MRTEYHIIINSKASSGSGRSVWKLVEESLEQNSLSYEKHEPHSRAATIELVKELTGNIEEDGLCHLIVLGGDGTLNTVLQGIVDFEKTRLSVIKSGSGNDFVRNMKLEKDPKKAIEHLLTEPEEILLDYGELYMSPDAEEPDERFLISCGVGYDADICVEVQKSMLKKILNKIKLGKLVYLAIGVKQIFTRTCPKAIITLDNDIVLKIPSMFFVVGMNHIHEGGGVPFCPDADPTDGVMDVCLVRSMPKPMLMLAVMLVYLKKHTIFPAVSLYQCKEFSVKVSESQNYHMDGEISTKIRYTRMVSKRGLHLVK